MNNTYLLYWWFHKQFIANQRIGFDGYRLDLYGIFVSFFSMSDTSICRDFSKTNKTELAWVTKLSTSMLPDLVCHNTRFVFPYITVIFKQVSDFIQGTIHIICQQYTHWCVLTIFYQISKLLLKFWYLGSIICYDPSASTWTCSNLFPSIIVLS